MKYATLLLGLALILCASAAFGGSHGVYHCEGKPPRGDSRPYVFVGVWRGETATPKDISPHFCKRCELHYLGPDGKNLWIRDFRWEGETLFYRGKRCWRPDYSDPNVFKKVKAD